MRLRTTSTRAVSVSLAPGTQPSFEHVLTGRVEEDPGAPGPVDILLHGDMAGSTLRWLAKMGVN